MNTDLFAHHLKRQRGSRSLRDVEQVTGISASTLSRLENGHLPRVDHFLSLCQWMGVDPNAFGENGATIKTEYRDLEAQLANKCIGLITKTMLKSGYFNMINKDDGIPTITISLGSQQIVIEVVVRTEDQRSDPVGRKAREEQ